MVDDSNTPDDKNSSYDDAFDTGSGYSGSGDAVPDTAGDPFYAEDDFLAAERYDEDEFDSLNNGEKPDLKQLAKEAWEKNPSVKIFAIVAGVAFLLIAYLVFGGSSEETTDLSVVRQTADVSQPPGTAELPPAYEEAVRQESERRAELARATQGSSIPTPIARPSERIEAPVQVEEVDPLSAWRREAEARRAAQPEPVENTNPLSLDDLLTPSPSERPAEAQGLTPQQQVAASFNNPYQAGNTGPANNEPVHPPLPTTPSPEMIQALAQQMSQQMGTVLETQIPRESVVVSMNIQPGYDMNKYFPPVDAMQQGGMANPAYGTAAATGGQPNPAMTEQPKPIIPAGTIAYAQILTMANSDVPGPVLAEVASGPLVGGRAIGQFQVAERHLVLQFSRIVKDGTEYPVQVYALDPGTTLPGIATRIDNHYFQRVFLPAAARFLQGFAEAATRTTSETVVTNGTVVTTNQEKLDTRQELLEGVNKGAEEITRMMEDSADRPRTIIVHAGTRVGLLFLSSVFDPNAVQNNPNSNLLQYGQNPAYGGGYAAPLAGMVQPAYNTMNAAGAAQQGNQLNYNLQSVSQGGGGFFR